MPRPDARFAALRTRLRGPARRLRAALAAPFVERQVLIRADGRVRAATLGPRLQAVLLVLAVATGAWLVHASVARIESEGAIAAKDREIGALKLAFRSLRNDVDRSEARLKALARTLEAKHAHLVALLGPEALGPDAARTLGLAEGDDARARIQATRSELLAQLGALELVMEGTARAEGRDDRARAAVEERLRLGAAERTRLDRDRRELIARLEALEERLAALNLSQRGVAARMAERTGDQDGRIKELIASAGVNVDALLARLAVEPGGGAGGPFIAADAATPAARAVPASIGSLDRHLEDLGNVRKLARILPLAAPSDHFYVSSTFGKRRDPLNGRWAAHYGVDLAGVHRSPVLATAPGTVTYVGWNGNYGRMVEIDHGMGIRTRYAHLHRILVNGGQQVDLRDKVGEMGSTGRSSGTHVHYEVLVNGQPRDPVRFMQAGEHVLKGF